MSSTAVELNHHSGFQDKVLSNVGELLSATLSVILPQAGTDQRTIASPKEIAAISSLCFMGATPAGTEDPKTLLRSISNNILDSVTVLFQKMGSDPIVNKISYLFTIEWCFRHGYLHGDWEWKWDGPNEGFVRYTPKIPMNIALKNLKQLC